MHERPISALSDDFSTRLVLPTNASRAATSATNSASSRKLSWPKKITESSMSDSQVQVLVQKKRNEEKKEKVLMGGNKRDSSFDKIELGLARARAAIRRAILSRNYTSDKVQSFVPRGSIYRNPYAFHQSYIEMEKRFKVWAYREGEPPLVHDGPVNNIYSTEGQFIDEMDVSRSSPFAARHPDQAHAFFIPFSVSKVISFVYKPVTDYSRERLQRLVRDYLGVVSSKYHYWNRSNGADHFLVSCHDWAPSISMAHPDFYGSFIRVLCNANTSEGFKPGRDASMPEINLLFGHLSMLHGGLPPSQRKLLAFFAGAEHGDIRKNLLRHWKNKDNDVQVYKSLPKGLNYTELMGSSKFCLCPSGYEVASPRVAEAIYAGCVPVMISDQYIPPFSDVLDWSKFSVQIPVDRIPDIKVILEGISESRYLTLQKKVEAVRRHFVVNRPAQSYDVFHMVLHSVWLRRLNLKT
ncbi:probable glycosyltransferase At5g11130 [Aristolochia californica]|uniref:probable glycosyltransferase At5g11130 n=1 Tax=Aristolochia californica TaxID=171875 RepID=UPI0035DE0F75